MALGIYEKAINNKFSWAQKIAIAQAAGYDFIEFSIDESPARLARLDWPEAKINELRQTLINTNFYFNSMALSGLRKYPYGAAQASVRAAAITITRKAIILAKKLGIRVIQLAGYDVYYERPTKQSRAHFRKSVQAVIKFASQHSVMLAFEIMDTRFMGTISDYYDVLKDIQSPWLKLYPDLGNLWQWTSNITKELMLGKDDIVGLHLKDTKPGVFRDVPFGAGTVNFQKVFQVLEKIQYHGPLLVEMWSSNDRAETAVQNIARLEQARIFLMKEKRHVSKT